MRAKFPSANLSLQSAIVNHQSSISPFRFQEPFSINRRHAAGTGGGYRLPINTVLDVAGGKYTGAVGFGAAVCFKVTHAIHVTLDFKERGSGCVADADKDSVRRHDRFLSGHGIF